MKDNYWKIHYWKIRSKNSWVLQITVALSWLTLSACSVPSQNDMAALIGIPNASNTPTPTEPSKPNATSSLTIVSGNAQSVPINTQASSSLTVLARNANGIAIPNTPVVFMLTSGQGTLSTFSVTTNDSGLASVDYTAPNTAGPVSITATANSGNVVFNLTVVVLSNYQISMVSGDAQSTNVGTNFTSPLKVRVLDGTGAPAPSVSVTFSVQSGNGNFAGASSQTVTSDASGYAQTTYTAGTTGGAGTVRATVSSASSIYTTFTETGTVPANSPVDLNQSTITLSQNSAQANGSNLVSVMIKVRDSYGNLIPNNSHTVAATFSPTTGAWQTSPAFTYISTGTYMNTYQVGTTAATLAFSASIDASNITSGAATLTVNTGNSTGGGGATLGKVSGDGQSVLITQLANSNLKVIASDSLGIPIAGSTVTFTVTTGSGLVSGTSSMSVATGPDGTAQVPFTAGGTPGSVTITASSLQGSTTFSLTVLDFTGYTIQMQNAGTTNGQSTNINTSLPHNMKVRVLDASLTASAGTAVRFQCQSSNCGQFSNGLNSIDVTTDNNGYAEVGYQLGPIAGTYTVRAFIPPQAAIFNDFTHTATVPAASAISLTQSTTTLSPASLQANGTATSVLTITLKDQYGNTIPTCSPTVVAPQSPSGGSNGSLLGSFSCTSSSGVYTRTYMAGTSGNSIVFSPTANGSALPTATLTLTSNAYSLADSTTSASKSTLVADNTDYALLTFTLRDPYGNPVTSPGSFVQFVATPSNLGTLVGSVNDAGNGTYTQIYKAGATSSAGAVSIQAQFKINSSDTWHNAGNTTSIAFTPGVVSIANSTFVTTKAAIPTGATNTTSLTVTVKDTLGNPVVTPQTVNIVKTNVSGSTGTLGALVNNNNGTYTATVTAPASNGKDSFAATINGSTPPQSPITITYANMAGTTISCSNYSTACGGGTCMNADLYVEAGTLNIDTRDNDSLNCSLTFNSVTVGPSGILSNTIATTSHVYGMEFTVTGALTIQTGGSINVNGKGYYGGTVAIPANGGYTINNSQTGGSTGIINSTACNAGGSHGGRGGQGPYSLCVGSTAVTSNALYDSASDPKNSGASGAGGWASTSTAPGGGVVRITAASIVNNGTISANANTPNNQFSAGSAGGSIKLTLTGGGKLTGTGLITANGSLGGSTMISPSLAGGGGGMIAIIGDDTLWPLSQLQVNAGSTLGFQNQDFAPQGGTIYRSLGAYTTPQTLLSDLYVDGSGTNILDSNTPLTIGDGGVNVRGITLTKSALNLKSLTMASNAYITSTFTAPGADYSQVILNITNDLTIQSGAKIIADGRGYPATYASASNGYTVGNTTTGGSKYGNTWAAASGAHGGKGSPGVPPLTNPALYSYSPNEIYDSASNPIYPGASGATSAASPNDAGGNGGGVIRISASNIIHNGIISANGNAGFYRWGGGGAGGSVKINASGTLTGTTGMITAKGGTGNNTTTYLHAGGGGGRISITGDDTQWPLNRLDVSSGSTGGLSYATGGTIYRSQGAYTTPQILNSDLLVDTSNDTTNILGPSTDLTVSTGKVLTLDVPTSLNSLVLNGYLTHNFSTPGVLPVPKIDLTVAGAVTINASGSINADFRGYSPGYTSGNSTSGAPCSNCGGSYGGYGGNQTVTSLQNSLYGSTTDPNQPGTGSGVGGYGSGGGLIRIAAAGIINNGSITANGGYQYYYLASAVTTLANTFGGSGGGIKLTLTNSGKLTGTGTISASANGAASLIGITSGAVSFSTLGGGGRIAIIGDDTQWPLSQIFVNAGQPIATFSNLTHWATPGTFYRSLGAYTTPQTLNTDVWMSIPNQAYSFIGNNTDLTLASGKTLMVDFPISLTRLNLNAGSLVTSFFSISPNVARVDITATNSITIPSGARIDVSTRGYSGGYTTGNTDPRGIAYGFSYNTSGFDVGANHLCKGGALYYASNPLAIWDSASNPTWPGGGGNNYDANNLGGVGGGVIRLQTSTLSLGGDLKANGGNPYGSLSSAGAGGSIYINASTLNFSGTPTITANAGATSTDGRIGASCGGVIKIETPSSLSGTATITANSGAKGSSSNAAGTGTVTGP